MSFDLSKTSFDYRFHNDPLVKAIQERMKLIQNTINGFGFNAVPNYVIVKAVKDFLINHYNLVESQLDKVLLGTSCCSDEVNRDLDVALVKEFNNSRTFILGGLAGFPFVGVSGFDANYHHVAEDGMLLIISASHTGLNLNLEKPELSVLGGLERVYVKNPNSSCCGAANGALDAIIESKKPPKPGEEKQGAYKIDPQISIIVEKLTDGYEKLDKTNRTLAKRVSDEIFTYLKDMIKEYFTTIDVKTKQKKNHYHAKVVIVNGIQINVEGAVSEDFFDVTHVVEYDGKKDEFVELDLKNGICLKDCFIEALKKNIPQINTTTNPTPTTTPTTTSTTTATTTSTTSNNPITTNNFESTCEYCNQKLVPDDDSMNASHINKCQAEFARNNDKKKEG